jgi:hypothetical protein
MAKLIMAFHSFANALKKRLGSVASCDAAEGVKLHYGFARNLFDFDRPVADL